jgi:hypothetical protein
MTYKHQSEKNKLGNGYSGMNTGLYGGKQKALPQGQHSLEFRMSCAATRPVESKNRRI